MFRFIDDKVYAPSRSRAKRADGYFPTCSTTSRDTGAGLAFGNGRCGPGQAGGLTNTPGAFSPGGWPGSGRLAGSCKRPGVASCDKLGRNERERPI